MQPAVSEACQPHQGSRMIGSLGPPYVHSVPLVVKTKRIVPYAVGPHGVESGRRVAAVRRRGCAESISSGVAEI